ncbi:MAG: hypothetical protein JRI97_03940 [Deltaproteobacteria bacterium]|nr:hypothetical protein [Deltaproteobacteria bacterium]
MPPPLVALFATPGHPQAMALEREIILRGGRVVTCDARADGSQGMAAGNGRLCWGGVDFSAVGAVHVVCTALGTPPGVAPVRSPAVHLKAAARFLQERERQSAVRAFLGMARDRGMPVVNPPGGAWADHEAKAGFYEKLSAWGFSVPKTLCASDLAAVERFLAETPDAVIKPLAGVGSTRAVRPGGLKAADLVLCPALLQERVQGEVIRAHMVAGKLVLALAVRGRGVDSRTGKRTVAKADLPPGTASALLEATQRMGLLWAAWDAVRTPDGGLVLLDCNPGPYVLWTGEAHARRVLGELAGFLTAWAETGDQTVAARVVEGFHPA